jgi:glycine/D-amino acid oxidase-like deaminating enzyme
MRTYSHIVVGAGSLGTAAAYWLAKSGARDVLVLEQFELGNERGASEDHSRIIRHSYHSADYTALTPAAYEAWDELEEETGLQLVLKTGGLDLATLGTPGLGELENYRASLRVAGIPWEDLDAAEVRARYPQWRIEDDVVGMYQEDTGVLDVRRACAAQIARAREMGATFLPHTRVTALSSAADHVIVSTDDGDFAAEHVIVCVASWFERLASSLGVDWKLTLTEEQVTYFATPKVREFMPDRFPVWVWHGESLFYGFPVYGEVAVKVARDMRGAPPATQDQPARGCGPSVALGRSARAAHDPFGTDPSRHPPQSSAPMPATTKITAGPHRRRCPRIRGVRARAIRARNIRARLRRRRVRADRIHDRGLRPSDPLLGQPVVCRAGAVRPPDPGVGDRRRDRPQAVGAVGARAKALDVVARDLRRDAARGHDGLRAGPVVAGEPELAGSEKDAGAALIAGGVVEDPVVVDASQAHAGGRSGFSS